MSDDLPDVFCTGYVRPALVDEIDMDDDVAEGISQVLLSDDDYSLWRDGGGCVYVMKAHSDVLMQGTCFGLDPKTMKPRYFLSQLEWDGKGWEAWVYPGQTQT